MRLYLKICVLIASIFCCQPFLLSQVTGSITGTVRDSSQAVVPDAKVSVFNRDRGINRETTSNAAGDYLVQGLGEGTYTVKVTAKGFQGRTSAWTRP